MQHRSNIYTIHDLTDLTPFFSNAAIGDSGKLVIFDIDDTLIRVDDYLASGTWFKETYDHLIARGSSPEEAKFTLLQTHINALYRTSVQLMDKNIPSYIELLRKKRLNTICLTAREGRCLLYATLRHLGDTNIALPQNSEPFRKTYFFPELPEYDIIYSSGILFTGGADKGTVLKLLLEKTHYHPTQIIFVDDSLGNVESVRSCAEKLDISFRGFHLVTTSHRPLPPQLQTTQR